MIGDRSYDIAGAAQHGIPTIFAHWGYGDAGEASQAAAVVSSPAALLPLIVAKRRLSDDQHSSAKRSWPADGVAR
jgi:phosphoglycolate phosphatase